MKTIKNKILLALSLLSVLLTGAGPAAAQNTAFNYQGRLTDNGGLANGLYRMEFRLYAKAVSGSPVTALIAHTNQVVNGEFMVALDFGASRLGGAPLFDGSPLYLQISAGRLDVSPPQAPFNLTPRQEIAPFLYSRFAGTAGQLASGSNQFFTGTVTFSPPAGPPFSVGSNTNKVANFNADLFDGLDSSAFWKLLGNAGTSPALHFLGTTDGRPLVLKGNNVGINRTNPLEALHVAGRFLRVDGLGNEQVYLGGDGVSSDVQLGSFNGAVSNVTLWNATAGRRMNLEVDRLDAYSASVSGLLSANGGIRSQGDVSMNDHNLYLRADGDQNHGLGYRGPRDGPFLYGWQGGSLGVSGPDSDALAWDWQGNVWVSNNLSTATMTVRGDATVSGAIRATGGLVIENRTSDPAAPAAGQIWLRTDL